MKPRWHRRLEAARALVIADGYEFVRFLGSDIPQVRNAAVEVLATVGWREETFLARYFEYLMRENRRA